MTKNVFWGAKYGQEYTTSLVKELKVNCTQNEKME